MAMQVTARQLHLFRGRRQRGSLPPAPSEFGLQASLVDLIRRAINPAWRFGHVPNGEAREHQINAKGKRYSLSGQRLQRLGTQPGWPDLQFAGPGARMAFLELKRRGGRLSEPQLAMRDHLVGSGFDYLCTDSLDVAVTWLVARGILRGGIALQ